MTCLCNVEVLKILYRLRNMKFIYVKFHSSNATIQILPVLKQISIYQHLPTYQEIYQYFDFLRYLF